MGLSSGDISNFVREQLDVDSTDLSDTLLDVYKREAFNKILNSQNRWPFMDSSWTIATSPSVQTIAFTDAQFTTANDGSIRDVYTINDELRPIQRRSHDDMRAMFPSGASTTGRPIYWSKYRNQIYFWPKPDAVYTYTVEGPKKASDWVAANGTPTDLPDEFHPLIAKWVLSLAYMQQDDPQTAQLLAAEFDQELSTISGSYLHEPLDRPVIMGRPKTVRTFARALYPNEYAIGYGN